MKKIFISLIVLVLSLIFTISARANTVDDTGPFADSFSNLNLKATKNGGSVIDSRNDGDDALGAPENPVNTQYSSFIEGTFLSLGFGGSVDLHFENGITNGESDDIKVHEVTGSGPYPPESIEVLVSENGTDWTSLGTKSYDSTFELGSTFQCVQHVRLIDKSDLNLFNSHPTADGFDIDAVEALFSDPDGCIADADKDTIEDSVDNCINDPNTDQADFDKDGIGDACDSDIDGDEIPNECDADYVTDPSDYDEDGIIDTCDNDADGDSVPNDEDGECWLDADCDNDGVSDGDDMCPFTDIDEPEYGLGVNRWSWDGGDWITTLPKGKQNGNTLRVDQKPSIVDTHGCSCTQILDLVTALESSDMTGHYKYGCSKSVIEEFIADTNDGKVDGYDMNDPVDEIFVPAGGPDKDYINTADSEVSLNSDRMYRILATGTYKFANWTNAGIADAESSLRAPGYTNPESYPIWVNGDLLPGSWKNYLELWINDTPVNDWDGNTDDHEYTYEMTGEDTPLHFSILDSNYGDNEGGLKAFIFQYLY